MELSNSIAFVGDIHLQFNNPTSRIDNYFEAILNKILQIMKINKYIVSLGDLFSNPVLDIQGTMMFIELLKKYKEQGGTWIEIIGNHTIYNWQLNKINKRSDRDISFEGFVDENNSDIKNTAKLILHCNIHDISWNSTNYNNFLKPTFAGGCDECKKESSSEDCGIL